MANGSTTSLNTECRRQGGQHGNGNFQYVSPSVGLVINKSQQGYSHIEDGRAELKIDDLIKLCNFYGVSADYFIGLSDK